MPWTAIRDRIANRISTVTGGHKVHKFRRQITRRDEVQAERKDLTSGRLSSWEITRDGQGLELIGVQNASGTDPFYHRTHAVFVLGVMAVDDDATTDSETIFMKLIEDITTELRKDNLLNELLILPIDPQVPIIGHDMFQDVLVHRAEIRFPAIERVGG